MSQLISDVLEVLGRIRNGYRPGQQRQSIREARIAAIHDIGKERGVTHQTIADAYLRRLEPDIVGTTAFDLAARDWLEGNPGTLRKALQHHAVNRNDELEIERFFA